MLGSSILEVAIGLVFVYLLLSLICSALQESLEAWLKIRASQLESGLRELLHDKDGTHLLRSLYDHPLIYGLFRGDYDPARVRSGWSMKTNLPTYIPPENFAAALMDTIVHGPVSRDPKKKIPPPAGALTFDGLRAAVANSDTLSASIQRVLLLAIDSADGDLAKAQGNIEAWFNSGMERVSGWYKRRTQLVMLLLGVVVAVCLNVDTLKVASELYHNDALRAASVAQAESINKSGAPPASEVKGPLTTLNAMKLPIGWQEFRDDPWYLKLAKAVPVSLLGWLLTAFAISFGAPFWFDLLNKLIVIRSTVKPREKSTGQEQPRLAEGAMKVQMVAPPVAAPAGSAAPPPPFISSFQPHEWATEADSRGGVL